MIKESDEDEIIRKICVREVKILKMCEHENIVHLIEVCRKKGKLHLVFEYVDNTLLQILEKNNGKGIRVRCAYKIEELKGYIYQILKALDYLHSQGIIHRDVKPENLLVSKYAKNNFSKGVVKLCDFGFARTMPEEGAPLTDYVATRWYRSPELLLTNRYGIPSDIWALGCIIGEMVDTKPLFPGKTAIDQLYLILKASVDQLRC